MREDLENLWYSYIVETGTVRTEQERAIIKNLSEIDEQFRAKLNQEQIALLEEYDKAFTATYSLLEKDAFVKGVRFATRFLVEALYEE